jgi:hypothetical protein
MGVQVEAQQLHSDVPYLGAFVHLQLSLSLATLMGPLDCHDLGTT